MPETNKPPKEQPLPERVQKIIDAHEARQKKRKEEAEAKKKVEKIADK